jgi:HSP20 family molecular chaperone IbpA
MKRSDEGFKGAFFDWDGFQKQFFHEDAWKDSLRNGGTGQLPWLEEYIKDLVANVVPDAMVGANKTMNMTQPTSSLNFNVFETHTYVIARAKLSKGTDLGGIRILAGSNELLVKGLPEGDDKVIALPGRVRPNESKAVYKNGVLEIRMPRDEEQEAFIELPVKFM